MQKVKVLKGIYYGLVWDVMFSTDEDHSREKLKKDFYNAEVIERNIVPTRIKSQLLQSYSNAMILSTNNVK